MIGQQLASRYEILKKLGLKPDSQTYLAKDTHHSPSSLCVVKQIYPPISDPDLRDQARTLVHQEIEKLSQLNSFSLVPHLLDNFLEDNAFYIVQEWIKGTSLAKEFATSDPYSEEKVVHFLRQALMVLHRIHQLGIIHQDIKPENWIHTTEKDKFILVDLGKMKPLEFQLAVTMPIEHRSYVAPEQLRHHPKPASDLYSLGIVALQAFTGQNPLQLSENEEGRLIWESENVKNSALVPIINKMIAPNITERYASTKEILEALAIQFPPMRRPYNATEVLKPAQSSAPLQSPPPSNPSTIATSPPAADAQISAVQSHKHLSETVQSISPSSPSSPQSHALPPSPQWLNLWRSPLTKGITMVGCLGIIIVSIAQYLQFQKEQKIAAKIEEVTDLYERKDYQECVAESSSDTTIKIGVSEAKRLELKSQCLLGLANEQANQLHYPEAIQIAVTIPKNSPNYAQAQTEIDNWSTNILQQAEKFYQDNQDLEQAEKILQGIPETSSVKKQALAKLKQWQENPSDTSIIKDICKEDSVLCSQ